jgi:hydrogenase 3 maturation protease
MKKRLLLTVGNDLMGDDAAGPMLAQMLRDSPLEDWEVLDGGSVPEDCMYRIREMAPEEVVIVDAADMGLQPGQIQLIDQDQIGSLFLVSTHALPLTYLMKAIGEIASRVHLIGIQPETVAFGYPVSPRVQQGIARVYACLEQSSQKTDGEAADLRGIVGALSGQYGRADKSDCSAQAPIRQRKLDMHQVEPAESTRAYTAAGRDHTLIRAPSSSGQ